MFPVKRKAKKKPTKKMTKDNPIRVFALTLFLLFFNQGVLSQINQVRVTGGEISGVVDGEISIFKGIPFAAPPEGDLRWKSPAPVQPWSGVLKADTFADACMQKPNSQGNTAPVNEDCLYLNVWTPATTSAEKLPVIVWIYGGGFTGGSTSIPMYDGKRLAEKGVVIVSLAYRVGVYGFLAHPELSREGNHGSGSYGIEDLVAGLEWVKDNIAGFGGDPGNVTIFGHSAGTAAVNFLATSPLSKGLFHRVIAMSGGTFEPLQTSAGSDMGRGVPTLEYAESNGEILLQELGVADIDAARQLEATDIQAVIDADTGIRFHPPADGYVLSNDFTLLFAQGKFNDTPVLIGHTSDESLSFGEGEQITPAEFEQNIKSEYGKQAEELIDLYPHATDEEATRSARHVKNDANFVWNAYTWARLQTEYGKGKVFTYYYHNPRPGAEGSGHGSDVPFALRTLTSRIAEPAEKDIQLSDMISSYWVNFARSGNPNGKGLPEWPVFNSDNPVAMVFDSSPGARPVVNLKKLELFDAYYNSMRK